MVTFKFLSKPPASMGFDVYRDRRDRSQFHLHPTGSSCESCSGSAVETDVEMPEEVYKIVGVKLNERGYVLMPHDGVNSELATNWWQLVLLLM